MRLSNWTTLKQGDREMSQRRSCCLFLVVALALLAWMPATGQDVTTDPEQLEQRIRDRIRATSGIDEAQRTRMENQLERCLGLGLSDDQVEGLFPMPGARNGMSAADMLRMQQRVLAAAEEGLPVDLLAAKLREGRMKGAPPDTIEVAISRMEEHLRIARREMRRAVKEGVVPHQEAGQEQHLQRGLALDMWRGLGEGDLAHLREQARLRARDGSCSTTELAAAAETATVLMEQGQDRRRVREMLGQGLRQGYTAEEMRRIGAMAQAAHRRGGPPEEVLAMLEEQLQQGARLEEMFRHMMRQGWMGPGDIQGHGAHSPVDDVIGGPWRHGGQPPMGGDGSTGQGEEPGGGQGAGNHGG
jgi:hypothetical protein